LPGMTGRGRDMSCLSVTASGRLHGGAKNYPWTGRWVRMVLPGMTGRGRDMSCLSVTASGRLRGGAKKLPLDGAFVRGGPAGNHQLEVHPMTSKKKSVSAAELMARLNSDPEFVAKRAQDEAARQARAAEWRRAETPLVEELRAAGFAVDSAWDLVNTSAPYPDALSILVDHLQRSYPSRVREGIARALAVPQSKFAWDVLTRLYRDEEERDAKDGLAVAISAIADDEVIDDVLELVRDEQYGPSRILLLSALERSSEPRARAALVSLGNDPQLREEIQVILRRLKRKR